MIYPCFPSNRNDNNFEDRYFWNFLKNDKLKPTLKKQLDLLNYLSLTIKTEKYKFNYSPKFLIKDSENKTNGFLLFNYQEYLLNLNFIQMINFISKEEFEIEKSLNTKVNKFNINLQKINFNLYKFVKEIIMNIL